MADPQVLFDSRKATTSEGSGAEIPADQIGALAIGALTSSTQARMEGKPEGIATRQGGETILLVEDDDEVRFLLQSILKSDGYVVIEVGNAEQALEAVAAHAGPIHLVFTDLKMPGMDGRQLAETLLAHHPGMKVMFMSGLSQEDFPATWRDLPAAFLQKPFMPKSMLRQIRKVFAG